MLEFSFTTIFAYVISYAILAVGIDNYIKLINKNEYSSSKKQQAHLLRFYLNALFYVGLMVSYHYVLLVDFGALTIKKNMTQGFVATLLLLPILIYQCYRKFYIHHHYRRWIVKSAFLGIVGLFLCTTYMLFIFNISTARKMESMPEQVTLISKHVSTTRGLKTYKFEFLDQTGKKAITVSKDTYEKYQKNSQVAVEYKKSIFGYWFMYIS